MTHAEKLNLYLLVLNSNFAIITLFLLVSAIVYIVWQARENRMTWRDWMFHVPLGITVAIAMYVENFGQLIVRVTVWTWRLGGGDRPLTYDQLEWIGTGSAIGLFGLLLLIRQISKPRFGEKMWLAALAFAAVNTSLTLYLFLK